MLLSVILSSKSFASEQNRSFHQSTHRKGKQGLKFGFREAKTEFVRISERSELLDQVWRLRDRTDFPSLYAAEKGGWRIGLCSFLSIRTSSTNPTRSFGSSKSSMGDSSKGIQRPPLRTWRLGVFVQFLDCTRPRIESLLHPNLQLWRVIRDS